VLTPRGEFAIVIAGLAVGAGLDQSLIALVTGYVLITVVAGPLLARLPDAPWFARWAARRQRMRDGESGPDLTMARD
jgi:CPA2 family monovalent cation:H+ antiporter-2